LVGGKYRLSRQIGAGAMGVVWAAVNETIAREVALKLILNSNEELRLRLLREGRTCGSLRHKNIVEVYDVGETAEGEPFLVMQLLNGETVADVLKRMRRLDPPEAAGVARDVALALCAAHEAGIIHRDLKPANILLHEEAGPTGATVKVVKVLDFGVCKTIGGDAPDGLATVTGGLVGSPAYMSPEQARAQRDIDQRSDIWSLGVVLFEMLAGVRPIQGDANTLLPRIIFEPIPLVSRFVRHVDAGLVQIVSRCLERELSRRIQTAAELVELLTPYADGAAAPPPSTAFRAPPQQAFTPPSQPAFGAPPQQSAFTPPSQSAFTPPSQPAFTPPSQQAFTPPSQPAFTPPSQPAFRPPSVAGAPQVIDDDSTTGVAGQHMRPRITATEPDDDNTATARIDPKLVAGIVNAVTAPRAAAAVPQPSPLLVVPSNVPASYRSAVTKTAPLDGMAPGAVDAELARRAAQAAARADAAAAPPSSGWKPPVPSNPGFGEAPPMGGLKQTMKMSPDHALPQPQFAPGPPPAPPPPSASPSGSWPSSLVPASSPLHPSAGTVSTTAPLVAPPPAGALQGTDSSAAMLAANKARRNTSIVVAAAIGILALAILLLAVVRGLSGRARASDTAAQPGTATAVPTATATADPTAAETATTGTAAPPSVPANAPSGEPSPPDVKKDEAAAPITEPRPKPPGPKAPQLPPKPPKTAPTGTAKPPPPAKSKSGPIFRPGGI
jgi:serine/threonine-protein kinase